MDEEYDWCIEQTIFQSFGPMVATDLERIVYAYNIIVII